jgi:hypothetical protein
MPIVQQPSRVNACARRPKPRWSTLPSSLRTRLQRGRFFHRHDAHDGGFGVFLMGRLALTVTPLTPFNLTR